MSQFKQKRSRTQAGPDLYNIYNAAANVSNELEEDKEETFEPGVFVTDLQKIINAYTGGTCDSITESRHKCLSTHVYTDPAGHSYNCASYCFQDISEWLLPILSSFPKYCVFEDGSQRIDFGERMFYHMTINQIQHAAIDSIEIHVRLYIDVISFSLTIVSRRGTRDQRAAFDILRSSLSKDLNDLELGGRAHLTRYEDNLKEQLMWNTSYKPGDEMQLLTVMPRLVHTILSPLLMNSRGCRMEYQIQVNCSYETCHVFRARNQNVIYSTLVVPDFPDSDAMWHIDSGFPDIVLLSTWAFFENE